MVGSGSRCWRAAIQTSDQRRRTKGVIHARGTRHLKCIQVAIELLGMKQIISEAIAGAGVVLMLATLAAWLMRPRLNEEEWQQYGPAEEAIGRAHNTLTGR